MVLSGEGFELWGKRRGGKEEKRKQSVGVKKLLQVTKGLGVWGRVREKGRTGSEKRGGKPLIIQEGIRTSNLKKKRAVCYRVNEGKKGEGVRAKGKRKKFLGKQFVITMGEEETGGRTGKKSMIINFPLRGGGRKRCGRGEKYPWGGNNVHKWKRRGGRSRG